MGYLTFYQIHSDDIRKICFLRPGDVQKSSIGVRVQGHSLLSHIFQFANEYLLIFYECAPFLPIGVAYIILTVIVITIKIVQPMNSPHSLIEQNIVFMDSS